jgi:hypothetical protein
VISQAWYGTRSGPSLSPALIGSLEDDPFATWFADLAQNPHASHVCLRIHPCADALDRGDDGGDGGDGDKGEGKKGRGEFFNLTPLRSYFRWGEAGPRHDDGVVSWGLHRGLCWVCVLGGLCSRCEVGW